METQDHLSTAPLKVLVVDDSRAIQAIIRRSIAQCGYEPIEVLSASDGEQALKVLEDHPVDLIITDWHMPKMTGLEMLQTVRQGGNKHVKVGFVTTERTPSMLNEAKLNSAAFIIHKPFDDVELQSTIRDSVDEIMLSRASSPKQAIDRVKKESHQDPVPFGEMQIALARKLGNIPFRLIPNERITLEKQTSANLLGLYSAADRKGVYSIGVMDSNAICIVGGGVARKTPLEVRAALAKGAPDNMMVSMAHEFMRGLAAIMTKSSSGKGDVTLAKVSMVKSSFGKLAEVVAQEGDRSDFRLSIPGYGEGRMAFFVLTA